MQLKPMYSTHNSQKLKLSCSYCNFPILIDAVIQNYMINIVLSTGQLNNSLVFGSVCVGR